MVSTTVFAWSLRALPFNETDILLVILLRFLVGWHSLVLVVGSKVGEVMELSFWRGGDCSRGRVILIDVSFPIWMLKHHFVYKSPQSSKFPIWPP